MHTLSQIVHTLGEVMDKRKGMRTVYHQDCRSCCSATPRAVQARAGVAEFSIQEKLGTILEKLRTKGKG